MAITKSSFIPKNNLQLVQKKLLKIESAALDVITRLEAEDRLELMNTPEVINCIKDQLNGKKSKKIPSFEEYANMIVQEFNDKGEPGNASWLKYGALMLIKYSNLRIVRFCDITPDLLRLAERNYTQEKLKEQIAKGISKPFSKNGINNYMRAIRRIITRAIESGIMKESDNPFRSYKIPKSKTIPKPVENVADFKKIIDAELDESSKEFVYHKLWLFLFYARGLNMVDAASLRVKDMVGNSYSFSRSKSDSILTIQINDEMRKISDYFKEGKSQDDFLFPIIQHENPDAKRFRDDVKNATSQVKKYMNRVGEKLGIDENLTSYVARYTFGTYAKRTGMGLDLIGELLGQKSAISTKAYVQPYNDETIDQSTRSVIDYSNGKADDASQILNK